MNKKMTTAFKYTAHSLLGGAIGLAVGVGVYEAFMVVVAQKDMVFTPNNVMAGTHQTKPEKLKFGAKTEIKAPQTIESQHLRHRPMVSTTSELSNNMHVLLRNKMELDYELEQCVAQPRECVPALKTYQAMIDGVRQIPDDVTKLATVNAWVNSAIHYDMRSLESRASVTEAELIAGKVPARTLTETLKSGMGVCDEQAQLKLYTLSKVGFEQKDIRYVGLIGTALGQRVVSHAVVLAKAGHETYALNDKSFGNWHDYSTQQGALSLVQVAPALDKHSMLVNPDYITNTSWDAPLRDSSARYFPIQAMNYDKAVLYAGTINNGAAPFYKGPPLSTPMLQVQEQKTSLGVTFENVAAAYRPLVVNLLMSAAHFHVPEATKDAQRTHQAPKARDLSF
jgi:hypothetical protein